MKFSEIFNPKNLNENFESSGAGKICRKVSKDIKDALKSEIFTDQDFDIDIQSKGMIVIEFHDEDLMSNESRNHVKKAFEDCINQVLKKKGFDFIEYKVTEMDDYRFDFSVEMMPVKIDAKKINPLIIKKINKISTEGKIELLINLDYYK